MNSETQKIVVFQVQKQNLKRTCDVSIKSFKRLFLKVSLKLSIRKFEIFDNYAVLLFMFVCGSWYARTKSHVVLRNKWRAVGESEGKKLCVLPKVRTLLQNRDCKWNHYAWDDSKMHQYVWTHTWKCTHKHMTVPWAYFLGSQNFDMKESNRIGQN